ncbi:VanZ family protein [Faecalibacterium sp. I3-3-33]|uniref:VanZ family protein n=1 Tax=Faecalibacterium sp. I3-3-33 TaxID=2929492 RepID=UPI002014D817|nr:VanZ family protein [Faecalibacterium sp. I3-3-33]UQK46757.1 VanZ family protein [Faecalibacterium sp. I3-3-33]
MRELLHQIHYSTSANLTVGECVILIVLGLLAWFNRKDRQWLPTAYSVFLILYITLLRRAPGYNENIRLHLKLWPNAGVWAGNLLNLILYVPFSWTSQRWKANRKRIVIAAFMLSVCCEVLQYITGRGMADVNDILFNTLGTAVGIWLAGKVA